MTTALGISQDRLRRWAPQDRLASAAAGHSLSLLHWGAGRGGTPCPSLLSPPPLSTCPRNHPNKLLCTRPCSLVREKPALLSDLNIRELRTMAGLSE